MPDSPLTEDAAAGLIARHWATGDPDLESASDRLDGLMAAVMELLPIYVVDTDRASPAEAARIRELSFEIVAETRTSVRNVCGAALTWALQTFLAENPDAPMRVTGRPD